MESTLFKELLGKKYFELTSFQKNQIIDYCKNDEEFEQMMQFFAELNKFNNEIHIHATAGLKKRLDDLYAQKYNQIQSKVWYSRVWQVLNPEGEKIYKRPLLQLVASGLLIFSVYQFYNTNTTSEPSSILNAQYPKTVQSKINPLIEVKKKGIKEDSISFNSNEAHISGRVTLIAQNVSFDSNENSIYRSKNSSNITNVLPIIAEGEALILESTHSDGIYAGMKEINYSINLESQVEVLDLLSTTF